MPVILELMADFDEEVPVEGMSRSIQLCFLHCDADGSGGTSSCSRREEAKALNILK